MLLKKSFSICHEHGSTTIQIHLFVVLWFCFIVTRSIYFRNKKNNVINKNILRFSDFISLAMLVNQHQQTDDADADNNAIAEFRGAAASDQPDQFTREILIPFTKLKRPTY